MNYLMKNLTLTLLIIFSNLLVLGQKTDSLYHYVLFGTVTDSNNTPLAGANIVNSANYGTSSNNLGEFKIIVRSNDTIRITHIGFESIIYSTPDLKEGEYFTKFTLYPNSVSLESIEIFPWPNYKEFKKAFSAMNKQNEEVRIKGIKMYQDRVITASTPSPLSPISYIYDRFFDKKAKLNRKLNRRKKTIQNASSE